MVSPPTYGHSTLPPPCQLSTAGANIRCPDRLRSRRSSRSERSPPSNTTCSPQAKRSPRAGTVSAYIVGAARAGSIRFTPGCTGSRCRRSRGSPQSSQPSSRVGPAQWRHTARRWRCTASVRHGGTGACRLKCRPAGCDVRPRGAGPARANTRVRTFRQHARNPPTHGTGCGWVSSVDPAVRSRGRR